MKRTFMPRALTTGAVVLTVALGLTGCGASNEGDDDSNGNGGGGSSSLSGQLNGAGATSQEAAMAAWKAGFQGDNSGVTVN
ncbi:MAG TPA: phosphate ABC transporter substrate-binding protein PstS, partial [Nocardioidaceae bacterium]